jgi:integrase
MAWSHYDGRCIEVAQQKVRNTRLTIPAHYRLREVLDRRKRTSTNVVIFTTKTGRPWQVDHLRHEIAAMTAALGHPGLSYHGLRKRQTDMLFEVGCTEKEVASILGWRTLQMAAHYSRRADQKRLAQSAIRKLEKADRRGDRTKKQNGIKTGKIS